MIGNTLYDIEAEVELQLQSLKWLEARFTVVASKSRIILGTEAVTPDFDMSEWDVSPDMMQRYIVREWMPVQKWVKSKGAWVRVEDIVAVTFKSMSVGRLES